MGTVTLDSTAATALLTGVRLLRVSPEAATVRLVAPAVGDVFVALLRGERMVRIQHGSTRSGLVTTTRRIRWASVAGTAGTGRVEETAPAVANMPRFVGSLEAATASGGAFSLTTASLRTATFAAGVARSDHHGQTVSDMHRQLSSASRVEVLVEIA